jgi:hypothetical protein
MLTDGGGAPIWGSHTSAHRVGCGLGGRDDGINGAMRAGAGMTGMVWNFQKRAVEGVVWWGGWFAGGKGEVEVDIRCQTVFVATTAC